MTFVSLGAIARTPIEMIDLSSNTGRQVVPLFVDFQIPPPAAATKSVLEGPGMPTTSESRPWKFAGPTVRHRNPATVAESSGWAQAGTAPASSAAPPSREARRRVRMTMLNGGMNGFLATSEGGHALLRASG